MDEEEGQDVNEFYHPLDGLFAAAVRADLFISGDSLTAMYAFGHMGFST